MSQKPCRGVRRNQDDSVRVLAQINIANVVLALFDGKPLSNHRILECNFGRVCHSIDRESTALRFGDFARHRFPGPCAYSIG